MSWLLTSIRGVPTLTAVERARTAGFTAWSPTLVERRRVAGRRGRVTVQSPAYSGYMLLVLAGDNTLDRLRWRFPDRHIGRLQGRAAVMADDEVQALRALEATWHEAALRPPKPPQPRQRFAVGAVVSVKSGLFQSQRGQVFADAGGAVVGIDLVRLGRCQIPHTCLALAQ